MKRTVVFVRDGDTLAVINVHIDCPMDKHDIAEAIKKMVTRWIDETKEGKEAWIDSSYDFNIGDLFLCEEVFHDWMSTSDYPLDLGIIDIEFLFIESMQFCLPFDMILKMKTAQDEKPT